MILRCLAFALSVVVLLASCKNRSGSNLDETQFEDVRVCDIDAAKIAPVDDHWGDYYKEDRPYNSFALGQFDEAKHPYLKKLGDSGRYLLPISQNIETHLKDGDMFVQFNLVTGKPSPYNIKAHLEKGQIHAAMVFFDESNKPFVIQSPPDYHANIHSGPYHLLRLNDSYPDRAAVIAKMKATAMKMRKVGYVYDGGLSTDVYHLGKRSSQNFLQNLTGAGEDSMDAIQKRGCQAICSQLDGGSCPNMYCSELVYTILAIAGINIHPETLSEMLRRVDEDVLNGISDADKRAIRSQALSQFFSNPSVTSVTSNSDQSLYQTYVNLPPAVRSVADRERGPIFFPHDFLDNAKDKNGSLCYAGTYVGSVFSSGGVQQVFAQELEVENSELLIVALSGHTDEVRSVEFSSDGLRVVTASNDSTAKIWNARTGELQKTLSGHADLLPSAQFSPDGSQVVTASGDKTAKIWNARTGELQKTLSGHTRQVRSAEFSPDGSQVLTASDDSTAKIWNARTGDLQKTLSGHADLLRSVEFSPDGSQVLTASQDRTAKIWNARTGELQKTLSGHTDWVRSAQFSPDGAQVVTASSDRTTKIWNTKSGGLHKTLSGHTSSINSVEFSPDGSQVVTSSNDKTAKIWNARTGELQKTLSGHTDWVRSAQFSPDGLQVVTASYDKTAKIWNARTGALQKTLSGHGLPVSLARFSPDGYQVVTFSFGRTRIFATDSLKQAIQRYLGNYARELANSSRTREQLHREFEVLVTAGRLNARIPRADVEGLIRSSISTVDYDDLLAIVGRSYE